MGISGEYRLRSEDRSGAGDRRAIYVVASRKAAGVSVGVRRGDPRVSFFLHSALNFFVRYALRDLILAATHAPVTFHPPPSFCFSLECNVRMDRVQRQIRDSVYTPAGECRVLIRVFQSLCPCYRELLLNRDTRVRRPSSRCACVRSCYLVYLASAMCPVSKR